MLNIQSDHIYLAIIVTQVVTTGFVVWQFKRFSVLFERPKEKRPVHQNNDDIDFSIRFQNLLQSDLGQAMKLVRSLIKNEQNKYLIVHFIRRVRVVDLQLVNSSLTSTELQELKSIVIENHEKYEPAFSEDNNQKLNSLIDLVALDVAVDFHQELHELQKVPPKRIAQSVRYDRVLAGHLAKFAPSTILKETFAHINSDEISLAIDEALRKGVGIHQAEKKFTELVREVEHEKAKERVFQQMFSIADDLPNKLPGVSFEKVAIHLKNQEKLINYFIDYFPWELATLIPRPILQAAIDSMPELERVLFLSSIEDEVRSKIIATYAPNRSKRYNEYQLNVIKHQKKIEEIQDANFYKKLFLESLRSQLKSNKEWQFEVKKLIAPGMHRLIQGFSFNEAFRTTFHKAA